MEVITTVANLRNTTEARVANDYTYSQILHIGATYVKDKLFVLKSALGAFARPSKDTGATSATAQPAKKKAAKGVKKKPLTGKDRRGLYPWYKAPYRTDLFGRRRRTVHKVMDLDGPLNGPLGEFVGKSKHDVLINRGAIRSVKDKGK